MPRGRGLPGGRGMPRGRGRGGQVQRRGMGNSAARRAAGKRKAGGETGNQGQNKRRNMSDQNWGVQPIAQQPLDQYSGNDSQWYQDSYSGNSW